MQDENTGTYWEGFKEVKSPEEEIVANLMPSTIYTGSHPTGSGKYISVVLDENIGIDVSTQIRLQIRLSYHEKSKKLKGLKITKYKCTKKKCEPQESVHLSTFDFAALREFLELTEQIDLGGVVSGQLLLETTDLIGSEALKQKLKTMLISPDGQAFLRDILLSSPELSAQDFVNVGYRKAQLNIFKQMLAGSYTEPQWQSFFENNPWIFGYGLQYHWGHKIGKKLENTAVGSTHNKAGKKPDGFLMTAEKIRRSVFVEIKRPDTPLLKHIQSTDDRKECWSTSPELSSAIAQLQKTARRYCVAHTEKERVTTDTGTYRFDLYNTAPKCILLIGDLEEFKEDEQVNEDKYSSFELFRSALMSPEIITFDELYERAKYIVETSNDQQ